MAQMAASIDLVQDTGASALQGCIRYRAFACLRQCSHGDTYSERGQPRVSLVLVTYRLWELAPLRRALQSHTSFTRETATGRIVN
jgi:hypothetical protein